MILTTATPTTTIQTTTAKTRRNSIIVVAIIGTLLTAALIYSFLAGDNTPAIEHYSAKLFDDSYVHTVDIQVDDWQGFLDSALDEQYIPATLIIDGEEFRDVGLRTKGNNSLKLTNQYGHDRYSLKIEFDQYVGQYYYGLDKFSLDSSFQDNSYMKTRLTMEMMDFMEVPTPLTSWTWVTVNGEAWGLFLAIEEPEEAFALRVYGEDYGQLYQPDYKSLSDDNSDVYLKYTADSFQNYDNIFRKAKFMPTAEDKVRLIQALKTLSTGEKLETAVKCG